MRGTHGTSKTRADRIEKEGFRKSEGRLGVGVYFWSESPYAEYLAKSWWDFENSRNAYRGEGDSSCAIIWANFKINEEDFLDLDDKKIKYRLAQLCIDKRLGFGARSSQMAALLISFVKRLEDELGHRFKVLETTVAAAPKEFIDRYPLQLLGSPSCYVVYDENCIEIESIV